MHPLPFSTRSPAQRVQSLENASGLLSWNFPQGDIARGISRIAACYIRTIGYFRS